MKPILRVLLLAILLLLSVFSCREDMDNDSEDLCTVSDSLPESIPGWSSKRLKTKYIFGNFNPPFKFLNNSKGYAIGATLIRTTDGINWQTVVVSDWILSYIRFSDSQNGYAWDFDADVLHGLYRTSSLATLSKLNRDCGLRTMPGRRLFTGLKKIKSLSPN